MTAEQQAILHLCDRMDFIEARLGLRRRHGPSALPELAHRTWLAEVALDRHERKQQAAAPYEFRSRRRLLPAAQFNSRRSA